MIACVETLRTARENARWMAAVPGHRRSQTGTTCCDPSRLQFVAGLWHEWCAESGLALVVPEQFRFQIAL